MPHLSQSDINDGEGTQSMITSCVLVVKQLFGIKKTNLVIFGAF